MNRNTTKRTAILVVGMHRSGTSALTRILNIAGCDLPKTLMKPQRDNVGGFWESQAVMDLNQEILTSAGSSWDDWRPFAQDWYSSAIADEFRERARKVLRTEFGKSRLFVLKDPRICRLLEFWIEAVDALGAQPLVVSPIRNPFDAASSLHTRNCIDPFVGHLIWLRHVLDAEAASRSLKRAYLRYEQLLSQTQAVIDRLGKDLGISWPRRSSLHAEMESDEFLSPALHHHSSEDPGHQSNPRLSDWIKTSFDILNRWSHGEVRSEDIPALDRIKAAFDDATPAFSRAMAAGQTAERENRVLSKELDASRSEVRECEGRIDSLSQDLETSWREVAKREERLASLSQELESSRGETATREGQIQSLRKELDASRSEVAKREERLASLSQELESSRGETATREGQIQSLRKELDASRSEVQECEGRIDSLSQDLETSWREVAKREERLASLSQELESSRGETATREGQIQSLRKELDASRSEVAKREERLASLSQELESSRGETATREGQIQSLRKELDASRSEVQECEGRIDSLSQDLETSWREVAKREERLASLSQELESSRGETATREGQIQSLRKELDASRGKVREHEERVQSLSKDLANSLREAVKRDGRIRSLSEQLEISRMGHVMAIARRRSRFGIDRLEANILLNPEWIDQARQRLDREPEIELRCNGRVVVQTTVAQNPPYSVVRIAAEPRIPTVGDALYSIHDVITGETLAALITPALKRARRVLGAVESRPRPEVRGWALDPGKPRHRRRVAIHVDGQLRVVFKAEKARSDIARWQETDGHHGFLWRVPEDLTLTDNTRIDIFDADTGQPLRGSPMFIEGGKTVASGRDET